MISRTNLSSSLEASKSPFARRSKSHGSDVTIFLMKKPSKQQQEFDRTRISISFGILSFQLALLLYLFGKDQTSEISVIFNGFFRFVVAFSIFNLFLFILCTASFYRTDKVGILDFLRVNPKTKDVLFGEAIEWSFVAATMVAVGYVLELPAKLIDISRCGEKWWSIGICHLGGISALLVGFLVLRFFIRSLHK